MKSISDYKVAKNHSIGGATWKTYNPVDESKDARDPFDAVDSFHTNKPYLVQITCVVESPMKLFVLNQNGSKVIFGSDDDEIVKNIVKFEANLRWYDFLNLLPVENKASIGPWKLGRSAFAIHAGHFPTTHLILKIVDKIRHLKQK